VRDENVLESALARQRQRCAYAPAHLQRPLTFPRDHREPSRGRGRVQRLGSRIRRASLCSPLGIAPIYPLAGACERPTPTPAPACRRERHDKTGTRGRDVSAPITTSPAAATYAMHMARTPMIGETDVLRRIPASARERANRRAACPTSNSPAPAVNQDHRSDSDAPSRPMPIVAGSAIVKSAKVLPIVVVPCQATVVPALRSG
jgi:hypothetical protein